MPVCEALLLYGFIPPPIVLPISETIVRPCGAVALTSTEVNCRNVSSYISTPPRSQWSNDYGIARLFIHPLPSWRERGKRNGATTLLRGFNLPRICRAKVCFPLGGLFPLFALPHRSSSRSNGLISWLGIPSACTYSRLAPPAFSSTNFPTFARHNSPWPH